MKLPCFVIFSYTSGDQCYVEGYPLSNRPLDFLWDVPAPRAIVRASGRTNARRKAYEKWLAPFGTSFNKMPVSPTHERRKEWLETHTAGPTVDPT